MKRSSARSAAPERPASPAPVSAPPWRFEGLPVRGPAMAWLGAVTCLGLLQPLLLGFYLDDWSLMGRDSAVYGPFSRQLWSSVVSLDPTRPVSVLFRWLSSSLLRDVPGLWQAALAVCNGVIVFQLASLLRLLAPAGSAIPPFAALPIAAAWMTLPWASGIRFWPTLLNLHVFFIVFLWLMTNVLRKWRDGHGPVLKPFVAYLAVCLGYEALYLQFAVLAILGAAEIRYRGVSRPVVVRTLAALTAAQACAVAWNHYARASLASPRTIAPDWFALMARNLKVAVPEMVGSFGPARWLAAPAFAILAAGVAASLWKAARRRSLAGGELACTVVILLGFIVGALASAAVFSVGGRPFSGHGVEARGMSVLSLWSVAAMGLLAGMALVHAAGLPRRILITGLWLSAVALLAGQLLQLRDWHTAARLQERVLSRVPIAEILRTEPGASVLCLFPSEVRGAPVFSSPWDLNSALQVTYPALSGRQFIGYSPWGGSLRWDGKVLYYDWIPTTRIPAPTLYIWRPFHGEFLKAERPFVVHSDLRWEFVQE